MAKQLKLFKTSDIAFYVQKKYAKKNYKRGHNAFGWAGISMLQNVLRQNGYDLERCDIDTVHEFKVILISLVSAIDWYAFIKERVQWKQGDYTVIIGGSGLDNIRPFLEFADIFVWGRAENIILPLIQSVLENQHFEHPSVCYSRDFSIENRYEFCQPEALYQNKIKLTNGNDWQELAIGCQRRCLFCNYTWTRKHVGALQSQSGSAKSLWSSSIESTIFELDLDKPESWPSAAFATFGIDGLSERLRFMVNKPITNEMIGKFLAGLPTAYGNAKAHKIKWYQVVGYPTETETDWYEFRDLMWHSSPERVEKNPAMPKVHIHHTQFKPPPCTPVATWPVQYANFRDLIVPRLQHENCRQYKWGLYAGTTVDFNATFGTESLPIACQWMITFRGIESDSELVRKLATSRIFANGNTKRKMEWLNYNADIDRFFKSYRWSELPTRYLYTHTSYEKLAKISDSRLRRYGGKEGQRLADYMIGEQ